MFKLIKIKLLKIHFLRSVSHISSTQQPHASSGNHTGEHRLTSLQKIILHSPVTDSGVP